MPSKKRDGYALKTPEGEVVARTVGKTRRAVWLEWWVIVADRHDAAWRQRYWLCYQPYRRAAYREGWRVVPVVVREVK